MITPLPVSGTPAQRALLGSIVAAYGGDQRVLAVGILGSLARGTGDEWSDLDLDLVLADGVVLDAVAEARALCQHLGLTETLVVSSRPGEVDVVLPSLEQFSIRYHPLGTTNAHIVDDLKIVSGRLDRAAVLAAGVVHSSPVRPMELIASEALRFALSVETAVRRGNVWQALRGLDELRWRLQELFAASRGLPRPAHAIDAHASSDLQRKLSGVLARAAVPSIARALANALDLLEDNELASGQYTLTQPQRTALAALRRRMSRSGSRGTRCPSPSNSGRDHRRVPLRPDGTDSAKTHDQACPTTPIEDTVGLSRSRWPW